MSFLATAALIDIEGTVGSIAFVRDVLFPYADVRLDDYVKAHLEEPDMRAILDDAAVEAGCNVHDLPCILQALHAWSAQDVKARPLKELQGRIWVEGFESSGIQGHLYDDAIDALRRFHAAGVRLYIYSSGSVPAQKLLFGHSVAGDLLPLFSGFYDTAIGGKRERKSYENIVAEIGITPDCVVFFSDNAAELDAAREAGLQTMQLARPEDGVAPAEGHLATTSFAGIEIRTS